MIKRTLFFLSVASVGLYVYAAPPIAIAPINGFGTPVTIAISTQTTMTKVPSSQTSGRMGIFIDLPIGSTQAVAGYLGDCTSTAVASTIRPIELSTSPNNMFATIGIREDVCLWLISVGPGTQNIHYQEFKQ